MKWVPVPDEEQRRRIEAICSAEEWGSGLEEVNP